MSTKQTSWTEVLEQLKSAQAKFKNSILFYRGHSNNLWLLKPTCGRIYFSKYVENHLYNFFKKRGRHLLPKDHSGWEVLFLMQHHNLPTRFLDWTTNFGVSLYFAVKDYDGIHEPCVWILNPWGMNEKECGKRVIFDLEDDFKSGYDAYFTSVWQKRIEFPNKVIATFGSTIHERMRSQQSFFTLHNDLNNPLEELHKDFLHKITIPHECIDDAKIFLEQAGINEFSLFPDLDGLSRQLNMEEFNTQQTHRPTLNFKISVRDFKSEKYYSEKLVLALMRKGFVASLFSLGQYDETPEENEVIVVGTNFPSDKARTIIKITRDCCPFLKYIRPDNDDTLDILIGGKTKFAIKSETRILTDNEFNDIISTPRPSEEFHNLIKSFSKSG